MSLLLSLVAALAIGQSGPQEVLLPNGTTLYAERVDGAKGFSLCMFVSNGGAAEDGKGLRHLLEHILAKGKSGDLAMRLETKGISLSAETLRDGVRFEIEGDDALSAITALRECIALPELKQEEIDKEVRVIAQERPVRSNATLLASGLWKQAFGEPDLLGEQEELAKATPAALRDAFASLFRADRVCVAVVGDIEQVKCIESLTAVFSGLPAAGATGASLRTVLSQTSEGVVPGAAGSGRAVAVGPTSRSETLAVIAAALAIANETLGAQVVASISPIGGLVSIVHPSRNGFDDTDRLVTNESSRFFVPGVTALRLWAASQQQLTREKARAYAQMLVHENYFRMEDLVTRSGQVSQSDFMAAMNKFRSGACVRVRGVR